MWGSELLQNYKIKSRYARGCCVATCVCFVHMRCLLFESVCACVRALHYCGDTWMRLLVCAQVHVCVREGDGIGVGDGVGEGVGLGVAAELQNEVALCVHEVHTCTAYMCAHACMHACMHACVNGCARTRMCVRRGVGEGVGEGVGTGVGDGVGCGVGDGDGNGVGTGVGKRVGPIVGGVGDGVMIM